MKFYFALEAALRIRRIREDQQRNLLLAANIECDRLRSQLAAVEQEQARRNAMAVQQIAAGTWGAELQFDGACRKQARILQDQISLQLLEAGKRARHQHEKYLWLRRERRAIEALRDSARQQFECEQRRREQQVLDENHLLFHGRTEQSLPND